MATRIQQTIKSPVVTGLQKMASPRGFETLDCTLLSVSVKYKCLFFLYLSVTRGQRKSMADDKSGTKSGTDQRRSFIPMPPRRPLNPVVTYMRI